MLLKESFKNKLFVNKGNDSIFDIFSCSVGGLLHYANLFSIILIMDRSKHIM